MYWISLAWLETGKNKDFVKGFRIIAMTRSALISKFLYKIGTLWEEMIYLLVPYLG